ncbi:MAG: nucleotide-binding protein [Oscillospiraceae bacterium]|nr:nucleotide-binding protein [Oscillospiraceae bacterium]
MEYCCEPIEYSILICDDNPHYTARLCEEISKINYKNKSFKVSTSVVSSSQHFIEKIKNDVFDICILDICMRGTSGTQTVYDYIRSDMSIEYYGFDLYKYVKKYNPNALVFVLSNLPVSVSRTIYDNVNAEYFNKTETSPLTIANYIKNYFKTQRKRFFNKVFIVYGHNENMRIKVKQYVKRIGIESVDLIENSPNGIKTIFDALNSCASTIECAIILLSADDRVFNDRNEFQSYRARQNVIFEMGFFAGVLGKDKVITIYEPNNKFEFPSDISGIFYIPYGNDNKWKSDLRRDLEKIGFIL